MVGVIQTESRRIQETTLIRAIAGEVHRVAQELLDMEEGLQGEGAQLQRSASEIAHWGKEVEEEEMEIEKLRRTGEKLGMVTSPATRVLTP